MRRLGAAARPTNTTAPLLFGGTTIECPLFDITWRAASGPSTLRVAQSLLPPGINGILERGLFDDVGVRLIDATRPPRASTGFSYAVTIADALKRTDCDQLLASYRDPEVAAALSIVAETAERHLRFNRALREFETLLSSTRPSREQLQQLLESIPPPCADDTFELHAVLDQLLAYQATGDTDSEDPLFSSYCKQLAGYAGMSVVTPEGAQLRARLNERIKQRAHELVSPSDYMDYAPAATADVHGIFHTIDFIPGSIVPPQRRQRMAPPIDAAFRRWHADCMVANGLIRTATEEEIEFGRTTGATYPHIAVLKQHSNMPADPTAYRFVLDLAALKSRETLKPNSDLPTYRDMAAFCRGKTFFSVIDLQKYYYQVKLDGPSQRHTLHEVDGKKYVYTVCPPGLRNAGATAMRLVRHVLRHHIAAGTVEVYMDDIIEATAGAGSVHYDTFDGVCDDLAENNLRVNITKLDLGKAYARYLGYIFTGTDARVDLMRYHPLLRWPVPTGRPDIRHFVGFALFFSKFLPTLVDLLLPLTSIADEPPTTKFKLTGAARLSFDRIRAMIIAASALVFPDYTKPFHVFCDTSCDAVGSILAQEVNGVMSPIAFSSKKLNPAQRRYGATTLEVFGLHHSVRHTWHPYIVCSPIHLWTDHRNAATSLAPLSTDDRRRGRWLAELAEYDVQKIHYLPAVDLGAADALSRVQFDKHGAPHLRDAVDVVINYGAAVYNAPERISHNISATTPTATAFALPTRSGRKFTPGLNAPSPTGTAETDAAAPEPAPPAPVLTTAELRTAQAADPDCIRLRRYIDHAGTGVPKNDVAAYHHATRCAIIDGIIVYNDFVRWTDQHRRVVVLPAALHESVIESAHSTTIGHSATHATFLSLRRMFWWPGMYTAIDNYVHRCAACVRSRVRNPPAHGTLSTSQATYPAQELAVDLIDPGDPASDYQHALVCVYSYSKYVVVCPLRSKRADDVALALLGVFTNYHVPHQLKSDLGTEFAGAVNVLCDRLGIRRVLSTTATKSSTGEIERVNREVQAVLRRMREEFPTTCWTHFLPSVHEHLRSAIHSATGFSPRELEGFASPIHSAAFGSAVINQRHSFNDPTIIDADFLAAVLHLDRRRTVALANNISVRDTRLVAMNSGRRPRTFAAGDNVFMAVKNGTKNAPQVSQPLTVIGLLRNNVYELRNTSTGKRHTASIFNLIPARASPTDSLAGGRTDGPATASLSDTIAVPASVAIDSAGTKYIVERVRAARSAARRVYTNERPKSSRTQQRWTKSTTTIVPASIIANFDFEILPAGQLVLPATIFKQLSSR